MTEQWDAEKSNYAIAGAAKSTSRIRNLKATIDTGTLTGGITYRAKLANGKWTAWRSNGKAIGAHKNVVAIQVKLTGEIADTYDVVYRAYIDQVGWQRRMRNGESAGVESQNLRIEAFRMKLVKKSKQAGWINHNGVWSYYVSGKATKSTWLESKESPIDPVLKGKHRYWLDSEGDLAVNRYVLPSNWNDVDAGYAAFATDAGYVFCGRRSSEEGVTLSDSIGRLYTGTRWVKTADFDGKKQRFRLQSVGEYSIVRTGLFTLNGKKYYGYEDGRGYVMRSTTRWAAGKWYKANSNGVLKDVDKKTKSHIERYVKWAIKTSKNNSHGYSQANRWGPDYDCSSFVCSALLAAGFPDSGASWTGNMKKRLKKIGFVWHKNLSKIKRGDIMLVHRNYRQHTEIYIGKNKLVGAHIAENGGIYGKAGDQTGNEISVTKYYNAPWAGYLRYRS